MESFLNISFCPQTHTHCYQMISGTFYNITVSYDCYGVEFLGGKYPFVTSFPWATIYLQIYPEHNSSLPWGSVEVNFSLVFD